MSLNNTTAAALKRTRERMKVTASALAEGMGINVDMLYRVEGGRTKMTVDFIELASKPLGYTPPGLLRELARDCNE